MPPVKTAYVPWFSPQLNSSQRDKPHPEQTTARTRTEPPSSQVQGGKRGNKRGNTRGEKTRCVLKVKMPKFNKKATKVDKTPRGRSLEPAAPRHLTPESGGGGGVQSGGTDSESAGRDAFFFSQRSTSTTIIQKEKAKLAVLRTITKVLEENQLIRQRLAGLSQAD